MLNSSNFPSLDPPLSTSTSLLLPIAPSQNSFSPNLIDLTATTTGEDTDFTQDETWQTVERRTKLHEVPSAAKYTVLPFDHSSPPRKVRKVKRKHFKELNNTRKDQKENETWPKFFIISKVDGDFSQMSPIKLCKLVHSAVGSKVASVRKISGGRVSVEVLDVKQSEAVKNIEKLADDVLVSVTPNSRLNNSQGVISCRDLIMCEESEFLEELKEQGVINVRRIQRRVNGDMQPTASLVLTFNQPSPKQFVTVAYYRLSVRPYVPAPLRCYKCLKFGHPATRCRAAVQICGCGIPIHEGSSCREPPECVNCGAAHNSRSSACDVFKLEKEIQRLKTEKRMTYIEARNLVRSKSYVRPQSTYAKSVSHKKQAREICTQTDIFCDKVPATSLLEEVDKVNSGSSTIPNRIEKSSPSAVPPRAQAVGGSETPIATECSGAIEIEPAPLPNEALINKEPAAIEANIQWQFQGGSDSEMSTEPNTSRHSKDKFAPPPPKEKRRKGRRPKEKKDDNK